MHRPVLLLLLPPLLPAHRDLGPALTDPADICDSDLRIAINILDTFDSLDARGVSGTEGVFYPEEAMAVHVAVVALEVQAKDAVVAEQSLGHSLALLFAEVVVRQVQVHQVFILAQSDAQLVSATLEPTLSQGVPTEVQHKETVVAGQTLQQQLPSLWPQLVPVHVQLLQLAVLLQQHS